LANAVQLKLSTYLLMAIFFVSQVFASDFMLCEMPQSESVSNPEYSANMPDVHVSQGMSSESMDSEHMGHDMSTMDMSSSMNMDCCDNDCSCPVGACASFALVSSSSRSLLANFSGKVSRSSFSTPDTFQRVLIKPPISA
jgi:hypothetical protein